MSFVNNQHHQVGKRYEKYFILAIILLDHIAFWNCTIDQACYKSVLSGVCMWKTDKLRTGFLSVISNGGGWLAEVHCFDGKKLDLMFCCIFHAKYVPVGFVFEIRALSIQSLVAEELLERTYNIFWC